MGNLSIILYWVFVANLASKESADSPEKQALKRAGGIFIMTDKRGVAQGNNEEAQQLAEKFSEMMKTLQEEFFVREGEKALFQLSGGNFITYCNITDAGVVFLVHVPEYRRYEDEAKGTMSELAWAVSNLTIAANSELASQNPEVAIGLKGSMLYGDIMKGQYGQESPAQSNLKEEDLEPFFVKDIKTIEYVPPTPTQDEEGAK